MAARCMTWEEAILGILNQITSPIHYREIAKLISERELRPADKLGLSPSNTVNVVLRHQLKDKVVPVGKGVYILKSFLDSNNHVLIPQNVIDESEDDTEDDDLITAYGRFWGRDRFIVNECRLFGANVKDINAGRADFSDLSGIYLLHMGHAVVYIGQAKNLSKRLKDHTIDDKRNRWDRFSWFSIDELKENILDDENKTDKKNLRAEFVLDTLEALLIETIGPERNKKVGNNFEDREFEQIPSSEYYKSKYKNKK